jgi:DNA-binding CsgD family transcriptional regulator/PAS domain-containing protein
LLPSQEVLTNLIGGVYDAAAEPALWEPFLEQLANIAQADGSGLVMHNDRQGTHSIAASWELDPDLARLYREYYGPLDIWTTRGKSSPVGRVCLSQELCSPADLRRTEVYNGLMVPSDIEHGMFGIVQRCDATWATISLYRSASTGEYQVSDLDILRFIVPHIQRAFKLHFQLSELRARSEGVEAALNMLATGIIFLGTGGEVLLMNQRAEEILNCRDGLLLAQGKLVAAIHGESARLRAAIGGAVRTGSGRGLSAGGTMLISRNQGRPLSITVAPLREFNPALPQRPAAVLFIFDPDQNVELPSDLLPRCYGLTPAEARLAMVLLEGNSLKEAADSCGVTHNTAKSQLKNVFSKTEVKRQGELIRLLLNSAGNVRPRIQAE